MNRPNPNNSNPNSPNEESSSFIWRYLSGHHEYKNVSPPICNTKEDGTCSISAIHDLRLENKQYNVPTKDTGPIQDGGTVNASYGLGPVKTTIDEQNHSVTNTTEPNHMLYPGTVTRTVEELKNGDVVIVTTGTGEGILPTANEQFAPPLWNTVDEKLSKAWNEKSASGKGGDSSKKDS